MSGAPDVGVAGAGPAGLAAAWRLVEAGARVTVYERAPRPGGRLRTAVVEGAPADVAVQLLASHYTATLRLARAAGAGPLLVAAPGRDALWRDGRAHPVAYGSPAALALSGALPARLKLRLAGRYLGFLRRHAEALDPAEPARAAEAGLDGESIADWGRRELGADFVELLAYPQLAAYYGATPEESSAGFYHALARAGLDVRLHAVRGGMGELAGAVAGALEGRGARMVEEAAVRAVRPGRDGVTVEWEGGRARHEAAVVALPAAAAARVADVGAAVREWLEGVRTVPALSLAVALEGPPPADWFGLAFPRGEPPGARVAAVCVQAAKAAGLVGEGRSAVVLYPAPAEAARLAEAPAREVLDRMLPALETAVPGARRSALRARVFRFPEGATLFYPGYLRHLRRFDPSALPSRLALAGDYLVAPTVEGAVRSGVRAAERLLATAAAPGRVSRE